MLPRYSRGRRARCRFRWVVERRIGIQQPLKPCVQSGEPTPRTRTVFPFGRRGYPSDAKTHNGYQRAIGRSVQELPWIHVPTSRRRPDCVSRTFGENRKRPPLIQPPWCSGFASKKITRSLSILDGSKRLCSTHRCHRGHAAVGPMNRDLGPEVDISNTVAMGEGRKRLITHIGQDVLDASAGLALFAGIHQCCAPAPSYVVLDIHGFISGCAAVVAWPHGRIAQPERGGVQA